MKSASATTRSASGRHTTSAGGRYVWSIAIVVVAAGAATLTWNADHKYAPAEEGTITLSRSF